MLVFVVPRWRGRAPEMDGVPCRHPLSHYRRMVSVAHQRVLLHQVAGFAARTTPELVRLAERLDVVVAETSDFDVCR